MTVCCPLHSRVGVCPWRPLKFWLVWIFLPAVFTGCVGDSWPTKEEEELHQPISFASSTSRNAPPLLVPKTLRCEGGGEQTLNVIYSLTILTENTTNIAYTHPVHKYQRATCIETYTEAHTHNKAWPLCQSSSVVRFLYDICACAVYCNIVAVIGNSVYISPKPSIR